MRADRIVEKVTAVGLEDAELDAAPDTLADPVTGGILEQAAPHLVAHAGWRRIAREFSGPCRDLIAQFDERCDHRLAELGVRMPARRELLTGKSFDDQDPAVVVGADELRYAKGRRRRGERAVDRDLALEVPLPHRV